MEVKDIKFYCPCCRKHLIMKVVVLDDELVAQNVEVLK